MTSAKRYYCPRWDIGDVREAFEQHVCTESCAYMTDPPAIVRSSENGADHHCSRLDAECVATYPKMMAYLALPATKRHALRVIEAETDVVIES